MDREISQGPSARQTELGCCSWLLKEEKSVFSMGEPHDRLPSPKQSSLNTFVALKEKEMSRYMTDITFLLTIMFYVIK